ncbi:unnamed protein product [Amoebophrya sp. A120]|nr:unnamed protein product [Amoebophrya sp. A120]|eukprot:GSA120T00011639001.1
MKLQIKAVRNGAVQMHEKEVADPSAITVLEFKQDIATQVGLAAENIRLVCEGRVFENNYPLAHYNVSESATIHCLEYRQAAAPSAASQVLPQSNPQEEMMAQLLNNPMMEAMMNSPEMMQMMLQMNPQLQQLCEQNPDIRRILEDPETMQQSMRAMRNPALMREMMRSADRGMAQLNTIPGGEDALRRLHTEMVDPLYDSMSGSGAQDGSTTGSASNTNPNRYSQDEIPTAPLANPFDQSRNAGAAGGPTSRAAGAGPPGAGAAPALGMPFGGFPAMGGGAAPTGGANPFFPMGGFPPAMPGAAAGGAAGSPGTGAAAANPFANLFAGLQQAGGATSSTASSTAAAARDPASDEFKLELKYEQRTIFHICKKTTTVRDLKGEIEPLVNFRRVYVRLIRNGAVWSDAAKTVADYLTPADAAPSADAAATTTYTVYILKNVESGQREIPLLPTPGVGAGTSPLNPAAPNPFAAMFGGAPPGGGAMGGNQQDALLQMLLGGGGAGGFGGAGGAFGGGVVANPRETYATQLGQLRAMGFEDEERCVQILNEVNGDVSRALDRLFGT